MLHVLQKEYTADVLEFGRWRDEVFHRRTLLGKIQYQLGRVIALTFIVKLCLSTKNVIQPEYNTEMFDKITKFVINLLHYVVGIFREMI